MTRLHTSVLLVLLLTTVNVLKAQQEWCATATIAQRKAQSDSAYASRLSNFVSLLQDYDRNGQRDVAANDLVYIPVVFHIVHNGDALGSGENISEVQILSQLDALNRDFNYLDPDIVNVPEPFRDLVADCKIQFCLAKFDPSGNPTTGIVRHQFAQATWNSDSLIDNVLKPATIWDNKRYLNIWSVRMGGTLQSQGVLAYATFPGFAPDDEDGVVARYNTIGTTGGAFMNGYEKGKTVSHEIGHWLGLLHTWGFGAGCGDQGDFISDTPDQDDLNFGCPDFPHFSCSGQPNGDMFMNYMDYTYDGCRNLFTLGQAERMRGVLDNQRALIKQSATKCFFSNDAAAVSFLFPSDTICSFTFKPVFKLKNAGLSPLTSSRIYYDIDGTNLQIFNWVGNLASQQEVLVSLASQTVSISGNHTVHVTLANPNGLVLDDDVTNDEITANFFVYNTSAAAALPVFEGFENGLLSNNWSLDNPNNDVTWEHNTSVGGYSNSSSSAVINNRDYVANPNKKRDAIITDVYDFTSVSKPELLFDVAYAMYSESRVDTFNVYYSLDCGSTWVKAWQQWGQALATATNDTAFFVPNVNEWKTVSVPLIDLAGQNRVTFKFENVTGWGNVLYLDNINLRDNPSLSLSTTVAEDIKVFPNPAYDILAVRLPFGSTYHKLELMNSLGQVVYKLDLNDQAAIFSVSDYPSGIYYLRVSNNNTFNTKKIFITK